MEQKLLTRRRILAQKAQKGVNSGIKDKGLRFDFAHRPEGDSGG